MKFKLMRALRHVLFSAPCVILLSWLGLWRMYPGELAHILGGVRLTFLISCATCAVGFVLCLVLCRKGKGPHERAADLGVIIGVQVLVFLLGMIVLAQARPARLVFMADHVRVVSGLELQLEAGDAPVGTQLAGSWSGPQYVSFRLPADHARRQALLFTELAGANLSARLDLHAPYAPAQVQNGLGPIDDQIRAQAIALLKGREAGCQVQEVGWLPMRSRVGFHTALISRLDGRLCDVVDVDLWVK